MTVPPPNSRRTFSRLQLHRDLHYQASAILVRSVCEGALSAARWATITPLFRSNDAGDAEGARHQGSMRQHRRQRRKGNRRLIPYS